MHVFFCSTRSSMQPPQDPTWPSAGHAHWAACMSWGACSRMDKVGLYGCCEMQDFKSSSQSQVNLHSERRFRTELWVFEHSSGKIETNDSLLFLTDPNWSCSSDCIGCRGYIETSSQLPWQAALSLPRVQKTLVKQEACWTPGLPRERGHHFTELAHTVQLGSFDAPKPKHNNRCVMRSIFLWFSWNPKPSYFARLQRLSQIQIRSFLKLVSC